MMVKFSGSLYALFGSMGNVISAGGLGKEIWAWLGVSMYMFKAAQ